MEKTSEFMPLLTGDEAAKFLGLSRRTLEAWRLHGIGPRYISFSRRAVRYKIEDLKAFVDASQQGGISDN